MELQIKYRGGERPETEEEAVEGEKQEAVADKAEPELKDQWGQALLIF
jgi:hypothetical protein